MSQEAFGNTSFFEPGTTSGPWPDDRAASDRRSCGPDSDPDLDDFGPPQSPDGYELVFDQDTQLDEDMLRDFKQVAFDRGLDPATAQALASLYEDRARQAASAQQEALQQQKEAWEAEARQSPEFRKDVAAARRALALCPPDAYAGLKQVLDQSLLGSHPAMIRFLGAIGRRLGEPSFHGQNNGGQSDPAKILYPNQ